MKPSVMFRNLRNTLDETKVRSQDTLAWLKTLDTEATNEQVWHFVKDNWKVLNERYGNPHILRSWHFKRKVNVPTLHVFHQVQFAICIRLVT